MAPPPLPSPIDDSKGGSGPSGSSGSQWKVIVGVVVGLGGALVIGLSAGAVAWYSRYVIGFQNFSDHPLKHSESVMIDPSNNFRRRSGNGVRTYSAEDMAYQRDTDGDAALAGNNLGEAGGRKKPAFFALDREEQNSFISVSSLWGVSWPPVGVPV